MITKNKCPFHINAKRSDMISKLIEEDYYQPLANGYDVNKDELFKCKIHELPKMLND